MMRQLVDVPLEFVDLAPLRLRYGATLAAGPEAVYGALAEDVEHWPRWFAQVAAARPARRGTGRDITLRGGPRFEETYLAGEPAVRFAYRVDRTTVPGLRALVEDWRLAPAPSGGTRLSWTVAADGEPALRLLLRLARPGLGHSFRRAAWALDRRLA
ncbi:SRPBCC family protein [Streptomyces sp. TRM70308]|uniref:SRPBCC family protein n=1 Tax=Streptomyces sp. TRM70308 TaxID=3131932 RepID=UPI003D01DC40